MSNPTTQSLDWNALGLWSEPVALDRPQPSHPPYGIYRTSIGYGGRWYDGSATVEIGPVGVKVAGVAVARARLSETTLDFTDHPEASREGKPMSGHLTFRGDECFGWCQSYGDGPVDWRGVLAPPHPPYGIYRTSIGYGGRWYDGGPVLEIGPTGVKIAGVAVAHARLSETTLDFADHPEASRDGKPMSGSLTFRGGECSGWCQSYGDGPVDWRGALAPPHPPHGVYRTSVEYGGGWHDEDRPVEIDSSGVRVAGVPVVGARLSETTLEFTEQPDASRGGKPWAGRLVFGPDGCSGWCQFPGEGSVGWRGRRL